MVMAELIDDRRKQGERLDVVAISSISSSSIREERCKKGQCLNGAADAMINVMVDGIVVKMSIAGLE